MAGKRAARVSSSKIAPSQPKTGKTTRRGRNTLRSDDSVVKIDEDDIFVSEAEAPSTKRRKVSNARTSKDNAVLSALFAAGPNITASASEPCVPCTGRHHSLSYHKPLFLCEDRGYEHRRSLLSWFDSVSAARAMPWRKAWIDASPALHRDHDRLREQLERRAYEVWISEIMLQQTRVAAVVDYWRRWMDRWPTIHDLAAADAEHVLAAWRGLGYYSRATRIHAAAKIVVQDGSMKGLLPSAAADLEAKVPGVGRYTAGAISAIVFGRAAPMVDGNVLRVLSRQLGIYGNVKTDKKVIDTIWAAAAALVEAVSQDRENGEDPESSVSNRPGRWGQALMELGSTICTPKPSCALCPVTASCRVYGEAKAMSQPAKTGPIADIEDACPICEPFEEDVDQDPELEALREKKTTANAQPDQKQEKSKQMTLAAFAFTGTPPAKRPSGKDNTAGRGVEARQEAMSNYARRFPIRTAKKPVRVEEDIVCAIQRHDGSYLIHRRPEKGLLAGLWEFPSKSVSETAKCSQRQRTEMAKVHVAGMLGRKATGMKFEHVGELGSVPWLFSHLKLTMHVHMFQLVGEGDLDCEGTLAGRPVRWTSDVEGESMGTGMRKCWDLVKAAGDGV
ncbi:hypothetical protein C2857_006993 [Epichloe festucae Fl1]|uniref:Adenine DNA glycosylase n=1 Tax=Epichloe festucae (strain Fl1) TaxID=877507 RepID=A0A7S9KTU8_EPIFF|nr:hypothetical protein C2857_006993 [Epichloe festucae Fl1]